MRYSYWILFTSLVAFTFIFSCKDDDQSVSLDGARLDSIPYSPTAYTLDIPEIYPSVKIPEDNPMTAEAVELGRRLFYDPILSADSTMACATCHLPEKGFTDNLAVSVGIDGISGTRSSMSLIDVAFVRSGLFWDGRIATLEDQALVPVEDPIEMHHSWPELIEQLKRHPDYPRFFRQAFGIETVGEIDKFLAAKALAQFERTILSSGESRYDLFLKDRFANPATFEELSGLKMFFNHESMISDPTLPDAECSHCHAAPLLFSQDFINNGLTSVDSALNFPDFGRANVTGIFFDRGKFRVPTLRNIALTAPYMHDGSMQTLEEVVEHYASGGHRSATSDPLMDDIALSEEQKSHIVAFMHMLTDTVALNRPELQNPFK